MNTDYTVSVFRSIHPQVGYHGIQYCHWPTQPTLDFITRLPNGSTQVLSLDGFASLTLLPHKQLFIVRFLAEVKHSRLQVKSRTNCICCESLHIN